MLAAFSVLMGLSCLGCDREYDPFITQAWVVEDSVKVHITSEKPASVIVAYEIYTGGCRYYLDTQLSYDGGNTYRLNVRESGAHPDDVNDCTTEAVMTPVLYGLGNFLPGRYTVHVNAVVKAFEITPEGACQTVE